MDSSTTWDFLTPWLQILAKSLYLPTTDRQHSTTTTTTTTTVMTLAPRIRYFGIDPLDEMVKFNDDYTSCRPDVDKLTKISRAMEIVALALRVEPLVWGLLRDKSGNPLVDVTHFCPEDLGAGVEVKCAGMDMVGQMYAGLFFRTGGDDELRLEYDAAKRRLRALENRKRLRNSLLDSSPIPLAITTGFSQSRDTIGDLAKTLESILSLHNIATPAQRNFQSLMTYVLTDVFIKGCCGQANTVAMEMHKLETMGVRITGFQVDATDNRDTQEMFRAVLQSGRAPRYREPATPPIAATVNLHKDVALFSALAFGERLCSLSLDAWKRVDFQLLAHVLLRTRTKCRALRHLDVRVMGATLGDDALDEMEKALAILVEGHARRARLLVKISTTLAKGAEFPLLERSPGKTKKAYLVLPGSDVHTVKLSDIEALDEQVDTSVADTPPAAQLESFSLTTKTEDEHTALRLLTLLQQCLPQSLKALSLDVSVLDDACVDLMLRAFPQLEVLRLKTTQLTTLSPLLAAYGQGTCTIRTLELGDEGSCVLTLLNALADPNTSIAHTLTELQLPFPEEEEPREAFLAAMEAMLTTNSSLAFVKITKSKGAEQLQKFHRTPLPSASPATDPSAAGKERIVILDK